MAIVPIPDLDPASQANLSDLMVIRQGSTDKNLPLSTLLRDLVNGNFYTTSGVNTLTLTPDTGVQAPTSYYNGMVVSFIATDNNTGAMTLNVDSLGATPLRDKKGAAVSSGDIKAGDLVLAQYESSTPSFRLYWASATTSSKGEVQLNNTLTSTSDSQALTAAQGKQLQDTKTGNANNETITGTWTFADLVNLYFGSGNDARIVYNNALEQFVFDTPATNLGNSPSFKVSNVEKLGFSTFANTWFTPSGVGLSLSNGAISLTFSNVNTNVNRILIGQPIDTDDWALLGHQFTDPAGARNYSLDMRRGAQGTADYMRCAIANNPVMRVTNTGNVQGTGGYTNLSDIASKENIKSLSDADVSKDIIMGLEPKLYDRLPEFGGDINESGFLAGQVEEVYPEAVAVFDDGERMKIAKDDNGDPIIKSQAEGEEPEYEYDVYNTGKVLKGVKETMMIPHLVVMVQRQEAINIQQQETIEKQAALIEELDKRLKALEDK